MNTKLSIIVAIDEKNAIGKNNQLLCHLSEDLKRFKKLTSGHTIVMGKRTYESLPVRPLSNRINIVITDSPNEIIDGCIMAYSIEDAIHKCDSSNENFIIGGASIYKQFMPFSSKLYITKIHHHFDADCFFPEINPKEWKLVEKEDFKADEKNIFAYSYLIYEKI